MNIFLTRSLCFSVLALILCLSTACAWLPTGYRDEPKDSLRESSLEIQRPMLGFIVDNPEGSQGKFDDPVFGMKTTVMVGRLYLSALGVQCKQAVVATVSGQREVIAICLEEGEWRPAPRIWGHTATIGGN